MKQILSTALFLCSFVFAYSQTSAPIRAAAKLNVSVASGSDPYTLTVSVLDDLSRFDFSSFGVGDSVYLIDGSDLLIYVITSKLTSPNRLVVDDVNNTGTSAPTGQGAIVKSTPNYKLPFYISGLRDDLRSMMMNRLSQLLDSNIATAGNEIHRYIGTTGVAPAVTAAVAGTITAQNTVGEIYTWNPSSNLVTGAWSLQGGGGGTTETASNGLTKTGNDIRLGGAINQPTTLTFSNVVKFNNMTPRGNATSDGQLHLNDAILTIGGATTGNDTLQATPASYFVQKKDINSLVVGANNPTVVPSNVPTAASSDNFVTLNTTTGALNKKTAIDSLNIANGSVSASDAGQSLVDTIKKLGTANDTLYVLATGQSNMVGYGYGGDTTQNAKVQVWETAAQKWQIATTRNVHDSLQNTGIYLGHYVTENNSAAWSFAKSLSKKTNRPVKLLVVAKGGQYIGEWITGRPQWTSITTQITNSGISRIDAVLWLQGEANSSTGQNNTNWGNYNDSLTVVIAQFKALSIASKQIPFIISKLVEPNYKIWNGIYNNVAVNDAYVGVSSSQNLGNLGDGVHFTGSALDTIGYRMLEVFETMPNTIQKPIKVSTSARNSVVDQEGFVIYSGADRDSVNGTALVFGGKYGSPKSPITGLGRILVTSGDTLTGSAKTGQMILGTKRGYVKEGLAADYYYGDDIVIKNNGYVGIHNYNPTGSFHIKPLGTEKPLYVDGLKNATLAGSDSVMMVAASGEVFKANSSFLGYTASTGVLNNSTISLSTPTSSGFRVQGNFSPPTASGTGLELSYSGGSFIYSYNRATGSGAGLLNYWGGFGNRTILGDITGDDATNAIQLAGNVSMRNTRTAALGTATQSTVSRVIISSASGTTGSIINPVTLEGLQGGSVNDSIVSSATGVIKRIGLVSQVLGYSNAVNLNRTITAGTRHIDSVSVLGASVGDFVLTSLVTDDNDLGDVNIRAWVSTPNMVTFIVENKRTLSIVFTNKDLNIRVLKK